MKTIQTRFFSPLFVSLILFSNSAHAGEGPVTDILQSGRDADVIELNREAAKKVDEALDLLGISRTDHRLEFVPSGQLPHLAVQGRPPVGHWRDGSIIVNQARWAMGVLEFVTPGCPTCRSFYSDSTRPIHQIEIFKHVGGHNDFSINSMYCQIRQPCDMIATAQKLYELMEDSYQKYDLDEVAQWYQYLLSLAHAQDMARGTFDFPEHFVRDTTRSNQPHPKTSTPHELQFLVKNLPSELPAWKKDMAILFEQMQRMLGYMVSTKIMNEGWATFLQEFLVPYLPWKTDSYLIEFAELRTGVAFPDLSNPYWLGREGWRNLYGEFKKRKEIVGLADLERDRQFVKYAHGLIAQSSDYEFLRTALNSDWIAKNHLFLYRTAEFDEYDRSLPQEKENQEQKVVLSTDAREVVQVLAKQLADRTLAFPQVDVENMSATGKNVFSLVHRVVNQIPLKKDSIAPTLFVRSQIWHRPVSLRTISASTWTARKPKQQEQTFGPWWPGQQKQAEQIQYEPIRIEVDPSGSVEVFRTIEPSGGTPAEVKDVDLTQIFQNSLDRFREELEGIVHDELEESQKKRFAPIITAMADKTVSASMGLASHSMTSASAILHYYEMIERRLFMSVKRALTGKGPLKRTKNGARIRILPSIPEFELDQELRQKNEKAQLLQLRDIKSDYRPGLSLFQLLSLKDSTSSPDLLLAADIGGGRQTPKKGDRFWGDKQDENEGEGEGDGDGEEGDEDEEGEEGKKKGKGNKAGKGGGSDPSEVEVPLSLLGEFLKQEVELPHLRPLTGPSIFNDRERDGAESRSHGDILWNRVMPKALVLGEIGLKKKGIDPKRANHRDILKEGMKYIQPSDWIVPSTHKIPRPETNAVIVIWMDMTGSMTGKPIEMAKQFMFNLKALLSTKYKQITFRYVGFSDTAKEFPNETQFFKAWMGGGTDYAVGIKMTRDILAEYPAQTYDRFSFGIGDAEDGNPGESVPLLQDLVKDTRYSAFVQTDIGNFPDPQFIGAVKALAADDEFFGHAVLNPAVDSGIDAIRRLLGKDRNL